MIKVEDIKKTYGKSRILNGISFYADEGECIGIVGVNGSGKSTLLAILAGILKADSGSICYFGEEAMKKRHVFSKYIGYVPQDNPLIEELSVQDNLILWYAHSKRDLKDDLVSGLPVQFGLTEFLKKPVKKLSGGMKKRLSLVCALLHSPKILIMDEPSVALDLLYKKEIHEYIKSYIAQKGTVIITTHDESDLSLCTKLYVMRDGKLHETLTHLSTEELVEQFIQTGGL